MSVPEFSFACVKEGKPVRLPALPVAAFLVTLKLEPTANEKENLQRWFEVGAELLALSLNRIPGVHVTPKQLLEQEDPKPVMEAFRYLQTSNPEIFVRVEDSDPKGERPAPAGSATK